MMSIRKRTFHIFCACIYTLLCWGSITLAESGQNRKGLEPANLVFFYKKYINEGIRYLERGDKEEAVKSFWNAAELNPRLPEAYINIGIVRLQQGNFDDAMRLFLKAESLASSDYIKSDILSYNLGLCSYKKGNFSEAIEYYKDALKITPEFGEALFNIGMSYREIDKRIEAFMHIFKSKRIFQHGAQNEYTQRAEQILESLRKDPQTDTSSLAEKLLEEGSQCFKDGELEKALSYMHESITVNPTYAEAHFRLGTIYADQEYFPRALKCFIQATELDPKHLKAYINLGSTCGELKKYKEALDAYQRALEIDKENPKIYYNIGMVCLATGAKDKARQFFKKAKVLCTKEKDTELLKQITQAYRKIK
ncbi:MAG: tetratricopeptide repeat protein [Candidatus Omnitrophota bacterium]|nr:MAG: tetratricopeptide repeat protein [Candidatus Omnitrophota bacterium]